MENQKKWSEQSLAKKLYNRNQDGKEVVEYMRVLDVCTDGMDLYRKHFKEDKYELVSPYDMIVLQGDSSPRCGRFYELEYTLGERYGFIHRALIQAVNPVTDIRLIVGGLQHNGILSADVVPHKARLANIDMVHIGSCSDDPEDGICFTGGMTEAKDGDTSVLDYLLKKSPELCLYCHGDKYREVIISRDSKFDTPDIFVCGSSNVNDPVFAEQREADLNEMREHIAEAIGMAQDYGLNLFFAYENGEVNEDGKRVTHITRNGTWKWFFAMMDYLMQSTDVVEDDDDDDDVDTDVNVN